MSEKRPKPRYTDGKRPSYSDFLDWLDRQITELFGANYGSVTAAINGIVAAALAGIDLSAITTEIADHEARITALEGDEAAFKTTTYSGYGWPASVTLPATPAPRYMTPVGANANSAIATITDRQMLWGRDGVLTNFRFRQLTSSGDADTLKVAININGSDSALSFGGIAGTDTALKGPDTSQVSISAGDLVTIAIEADTANATSSTDQTWSFDFVDAA